MPAPLNRSLPQVDDNLEPFDSSIAGAHGIGRRGRPVPNAWTNPPWLHPKTSNQKRGGRTIRRKYRWRVAPLLLSGKESRSESPAKRRGENSSEIQSSHRRNGRIVSSGGGPGSCSSGDILQQRLRRGGRRARILTGNQPAIDDRKGLPVPLLLKSPLSFAETVESARVIPRYRQYHWTIVLIVRFWLNQYVWFIRASRQAGELC